MREGRWMPVSQISLDLFRYFPGVEIISIDYGKLEIISIDYGKLLHLISFAV